jgi:hypothetical protein
MLAILLADEVKTAVPAALFRGFLAKRDSGLNPDGRQPQARELRRQSYELAFPAIEARVSAPLQQEAQSWTFP